MGSPRIRNENIAKQEAEHAAAKYNADGTINKNWTPSGKESARGGFGTAESRYTQAYQDYKREQDNRRRDANRVERANKRYNDAKRRGEQLDRAKTAMASAPYVNKVQERKKKQRAKLKAAAKRGYYMGDDN